MSGTRKLPPISTNWPRLTNHLTAAREGGKRQKHRRGVVIDGHRCLRAGDLLEQRLDVSLAAAP